ncbi:hypothetical protein BASA50_003407 [Batrachochytrium salamandrivorans]|uniref:Katanin p60 ATPase-containing subunit A-like 2 n=1 Tax=Batrachochytrium salamandrivorans TaxID=1357716 RepID=A0ABQ8FIN3_9FUNG|nr:hypothetical protein BASA60_002546 [Batrachochytrium salamandrivorans]KAH6598900.1 hypothetical protein BASA50_003407 [Batrachochytrium salamandrivorans]KAH9248966.1 hypothetical protein BASA81_013366 [Batrachochytrium salamandrivorans]KAJ1339073.1 hypothetical protein BSLG_006211 [Batrachochytrium salamandrivorans]
MASVEKLQAEANISLKKITAADNIDLTHIFQEFESYYFFKFGKAAKLVRKNIDGEMASTSISHPKGSHTYNDTIPRDSLAHSRAVPLPKIVQQPNSHGQLFPRYQESASTFPAAPPASQRKLPPPAAATECIAAENISAIGTKVGLSGHGDTPNVSSKPLDSSGIAPAAEQTDPSQSNADRCDQKLLKPMPEYANSEFRELAAIITRDIFLQNPNVKWTDIAGLSSSKRLIKEAIVFPIKFPSLFTGLLKPWKGLLMFGPPGTGKTMLAKAVATECKTTFFNISASSVVSKWRGDSEKLVRVLFELARYHAPSTIFLDELESIMGQRTSDGGEHEGSRRMKTELLIQMDGLAKGNEHVFLLGASNLPWDLDVAMLRRLEKRILIDLPDVESRQLIFKKLLPADIVDDKQIRIVGDLNYNELASLTQGYSGSDISLVCREAAMRPLRKIFDKLESMTIKVDNESQPITDNTNMGDYGDISRDAISQGDVVEAIMTTKPTCDVSLATKYQDWQKSFSSI